MNEETRSEELSWKEWVEHLMQLTENEQFTELLNKAKEMKDKTMNLEHDVGDKLKEISRLKEQAAYMDNEIKHLRHRCRDTEDKMYCLKEINQKRIRHLRVSLVSLITCFLIVLAILFFSSL